MLKNWMYMFLLDEATDPANPPGNPPPAADPPKDPPAAPTWDQIRNALPEDIRNDSVFERVTSLEGLAKSYVHAQKSIGQNKIAVPDKHATSEDYKQVMFKLGLSENLEDYKMNLPDDVEKEDEFVKKFTEASHKAGILPHQAEEVFKWYRDYSTDIVDNHKAQMTAKLADEEQHLRQVWGKAYEENLEKSSIALKELVPDEAERQAFIESGQVKNRTVLKILAQASKFFDEDTIIGHGGTKFTKMTPDEALIKAREIQGDMNHPYRTPSHPNHEAAKKEVANLYKIAFPD